MDRGKIHQSKSSLCWTDVFVKLLNDILSCRINPYRNWSHLLTDKSHFQHSIVMYDGTGGVNTHKGALFSLGLLCGSAGRTIGKVEGKSRLLRAGILCFTAARMVRGISKRELTHPNSPTKGSEAYRQYRIKGARGEAEQGFPHVRLLALTIFLDSISHL